MRAKKSLGQNFLMHQQTASRIADAANLSKSDVVFEIGPGTGMLTRELLARAKQVIAVEADGALYESLCEQFADEIQKKKLVLSHDDIRTFNLETLPKTYALVANIPYYLTGEIIRRFLESAQKPSTMTLLVQKEVAVRIARSKKESLGSVSVKVFGVPKLVFTVPRGAFVPSPNVDSAVLRITDISGKSFKKSGEEKWFFDVVRAGFAHKRKRLAKNLESVAKPENITRAFTKLGLPKDVRPEEVGVNAWLSLSKELRNR